MSLNEGVFQTTINLMKKLEDIMSYTSVNDVRDFSSVMCDIYTYKSVKQFENIKNKIECLYD